MAVAYEPRSSVQQLGGGEALFAAHQGRILRAAYRVTGNMADAEDVVQSVFLKLLHTRLPEIANLESYLYRAAINGALDLMRRRVAAREIPLEETVQAPALAGGEPPDNAISLAETRSWIRQALARLSPRAAEMFVMRYLEDRSNREIARITGTSAAVVAVTLHYSRNKLRKLYQGFLRGGR